MPSFTWTIPSSSTPTPPPPSVATEDPADVLFGGFDQELDPTSSDYTDTDDGAWGETASSRSAVMCQLSIRYNSWPADPDAGVRLYEMLESGDPVTPDMVEDDTKRAMQVLVDDGIVADLAVDVGAFDVEAGRLEVNLSYTDVASGHTVELVFSPV